MLVKFFGGCKDGEKMQIAEPLPLTLRFLANAGEGLSIEGCNVNDSFDVYRLQRFIDTIDGVEQQIVYQYHWIF